jgi:hypothetical protein
MTKRLYNKLHLIALDKRSLTFISSSFKRSLRTGCFKNCMVKREYNYIKKLNLKKFEIKLGINSIQ